MGQKEDEELKRVVQQDSWLIIQRVERLRFGGRG